MISVNNYVRLACVTTALAMIVVVLGAFVRLSDAGLSCPDWPGCYGRILVPDTPEAIASAEAAYPERSLEAGKAWKEMAHRYLAGALGLLVAALAVFAWRRRNRPGQQVLVPIGLVALVVFQALLGMWTVTHKLNPLIVMGHLLGGLTTTAMLWWLCLRQGSLFTAHRADTVPPFLRAVRPWVILGLVILYLQLALGGWTSANYAALACPDFPRCQGQWLPPLEFREALTVWRASGTDYEGGVLSNDARVTVHLLHRAGAAVTFIYLLWLALFLALRAPTTGSRRAGGVLAVVLTAQVALGIGNVVLHLPLGIAVAHNGVAVLLLLTMVTVYHMARPPRASV